MNEALYLKYRPQKLSEIYGQDTVVKILQNSLDKNLPLQSIIFYGPRGVGKTSAARILARAVNCLSDGEKPCGKCESCLKENNLDIIEIDGATHNGVDIIRDLKEKVNFMPTDSKYKVYIIDEFHMISTSAFNALLKTLEEPPKHVLFILATTEIEKVPETIISRCMMVEFERMSIESIVDRLSFIAKEEKINIDKDVLTEIAKQSNGGMRDSISMLEKLSIFAKDKKINIDDYTKVSGNLSSQDINNFIDLYIDDKKIELINYVDKIDKTGIDLVKLLEQSIKMISENINENNCSIIIKFNEYINEMKLSSFPVAILKSFIYKDLRGNSNQITETADIKLKEKEIKEEVIVYDAEELKSSCMRNASKEIKNNLIELWSKKDKYKYDVDFGSLLPDLDEIDIAVTSNEIIILFTSDDKKISNINKNVSKYLSLFEEIFRGKYKVLVVSDTEWKDMQEAYINALKAKKNVSNNANKEQQETKKEETNSFDKLFKNVERID